MEPSNIQAPLPADQPISPSNDELSMKDVIQELRLWRKLVFQHWKLLLIGSLLAGASGYFYASTDVPMYMASTRFMLKNEGVGSLFGGQMSTLTGLLGGGQMGTPLERTAEVISSDRIIGKALLREIKVHDTSDLAINHFIRLSDLRIKWAKDKLMANVSYNIEDDDVLKMSTPQRKAFKMIKSMMIPEKGVGIVRKTFDKKSGILTLSCVHQDEEFAIQLSQAIYQELNVFFIEQMTYSSTNNAEVMKRKLDSVQGELNAVRRAYAAQTDQSQGLLLQQDKVDLKALAVKEQMLNVMYAEALKNYESFEFINKAAIPSLTLIDFPYSPIRPALKNKFIYGLFFSILSIVCVFIFIRFKLYVFRHWV